MKNTVKALRYIVSIFLIILFVGCSSKSGEFNSPKIYVSKQLKINNIEFDLIEYHKPEIVYHTKDELEAIFKEDFLKKLDEKKILTEDLDADLVDIKIEYKRRYAGDETPFKSDSLGSPNYAYTVVVKNNIGNEILQKDRGNLTFQGGLAMNLKIVAGGLRDKKYEIGFIKVLSNAIVDELDKLDKK